MTFSQTLLTRFKANNGGISDYRAAIMLDYTRSYISKISNGNANFSAEKGIQIAKTLGIDPEEAAIRLLVDSTGNEELRNLYKGIQEKLAH